MSTKPDAEKVHRMSSRILGVQAFILFLCGAAIFLLVWNFPYPSPLIKPFLPPKLRWPTDEIMSWVEQGQFDRDFARYFARDPDRKIPANTTLVSPADGIVQNIRFVDDVSYLVIGLSFWDVHVVRTPVAGTIKSIDMEGSYVSKLSTQKRYMEENFLRGKEAPVETVLTLETDRGDVRIRMITSYWASRLKVWVHPGEKLNIGDRVGRIVLGSTVVTEFPGKLLFDVKLGEHVNGGSSALVNH